MIFFETRNTGKPHKVQRRAATLVEAAISLSAMITVIVGCLDFLWRPISLRY